MKNALIIDDDAEVRQLLDSFLSRQNFQVSTAGTGDESLNLLRDTNYSVVLCDYKLPDTNGIDMLDRIKIIQPEAPVIMITGFPDSRIATTTMKKGAYDYVQKPLQADHILKIINSASLSVPHKDNQSNKAGGKTESRTSSIELLLPGSSTSIQQVRKMVQKVAPTTFSVVISGETGTGKEYTAKAIQKLSNRNDKPFIAVDCGTLSEELMSSELFGHVKGAFTGALNNKTGCFEDACGGTLFLDEIANLSLKNQKKLLRVLQERKIRKLGSSEEICVDVRVLVASNANLKRAVEAGDFREDLFFRLNEFEIELPPVRERKEDIPAFANLFLEHANKELNKSIEGFEDEVLHGLLKNTWSGNLREMNNMIKKAALMCDGNLIKCTHFPSSFCMEQECPDDNQLKGDELKTVSRRAERSVILEALEQNGYNKTATAQYLGIDRKTLYNKLGLLNIKSRKPSA